MSCLSGYYSNFYCYYCSFEGSIASTVSAASAASTPPQTHAGGDTNSLHLPGGGGGVAGAGALGSSSAAQQTALTMSPRPQHRAHGAGTQARGRHEVFLLKTRRDETSQKRDEPLARA